MNLLENLKDDLQKRSNVICKEPVISYLKFLSECLILESRIDSVKKNNSDVPESVIDHYVNHALPANDKTHIDWVVKQHKLGNITPDTADKLKPIIDTYSRNKASLGKISSYNVDSLTTATEPLIDSNLTKNKVADKNTETIYDSPSMRVQKHIGFESAKKGRTLHLKNKTRTDCKGTWCVGISPRWHSLYTANGDFYTIENKTGNHEKTGMILNKHLNSSMEGYEVRNESDKMIRPHEILDRHPEINKVPELHEFFSKHLSYKLSTANNANELHDIIHSMSINDIHDNITDITKHRHITDSHLKTIIDLANEHGNTELFRKILWDNNTSKHILHYAIDNNPHNVGTSSIVSNNNAKGDEDIYEKMIKSKDIHGAMSAAEVTKKHIALAMNHSDEDVRASAMMNPSFHPTSDDIDSSMKSNNINFMIGYSENKNTKQSDLKKLATHKSMIDSMTDSLALNKITDANFLNNQYDKASLDGKASILPKIDASDEMLKSALHPNNPSSLILAALNHKNLTKAVVNTHYPNEYKNPLDIKKVLKKQTEFV